MIATLEKSVNEVRGKHTCFHEEQLLLSVENYTLVVEKLKILGGRRRKATKIIL